MTLIDPGHSVENVAKSLCKHRVVFSFGVHPVDDFADISETAFGDSIEYQYELRTTFWIAAAGIGLGLFTSMSLLCCCFHAGNGPLSCCSENEGCCTDDAVVAQRGQTAHQT